MASGFWLEPSTGSSYVVADVEYESCAEELLLWGGEETLIRPSDMRTLVMDFPSALPLRKLGVLELNVLYIESLLALEGFLDVRFLSTGARGLGGTRVSPLGGCGNELMLTLFRIVFPAPFTPAASLDCGSAGDGLGGARLRVEGVRSPDLGVPGADLLEVDDEGIFPVLLRVLLTGRAGKAMFGGPTEGRDGRGSVVVMAACVMKSSGKKVKRVKDSQAQG